MMGRCLVVPLALTLGPNRWLRSRCSTCIGGSTCSSEFTKSTIILSVFSGVSASAKPWKRRFGRREYCSTSSAVFSKKSTRFPRSTMRFSFRSSSFVSDTTVAVRFVILFFSSIGNKVSLSFATIAVSFNNSRTDKASVSLLIVYKRSRCAQAAGDTEPEESSRSRPKSMQAPKGARRGTRPSRDKPV